MKVIICGAGQVGSSIARHLAMEGADVTVIDISAQNARRIDESFDVLGMVGHASYPEVLERAGARDADMLIAVTRSDEVNMVACQVAYSIFKIPRRIARLRHQGYLAPIWKGLYADDQLPINVIITPELEVANGIVRRLKTPGAFDTVMLGDGRIQLLGIHCTSSTCALRNREIGGLLAMEPNIAVVALVRDGEAFLPAKTERLRLGDSVYVIIRPEDADRVMQLFGHEEKAAHRIVIIGAGNVGLSLAKRLADSVPALSMKLIENSEHRAEQVSRELGSNAVVIHGDALDKEILTEANISGCQTVVAVTDDDETNIFASVLAKREGCARAITLVNKSVYEGILPGLGIDAVVSPNNITISGILRHVRPRSVSALYTLRENFGEVIEATAQPQARITREPLGEIEIPDGMLIGAIVRQNQVIMPSDDLAIEAGDHVIAMVTYEALQEAEHLLGTPGTEDTRDGMATP
jgi:trk system potassium uptake protein TrkA